MVSALLAGPFVSSSLDEAYLWFCVRYVERNPVRAGMVSRGGALPSEGGFFADDELCSLEGVGHYGLVRLTSRGR